MEINNLFVRIHSFEEIMTEERQEMDKLQAAYETREEEFLNISKEVSRLNNMYESKVEILTNKINNLKSENKAKIEKLSESGNILNYNTNQVKTLKTQLELKTEELANFKRDFEQLLDLKTQKIIDLQNLLKARTININKSTSKVDEEIKLLMKKLYLSTADIPVNDK